MWNHNYCQMADKKKKKSEGSEMSHIFNVANAVKKFGAVEEACCNVALLRNAMTRR